MYGAPKGGIIANQLPKKRVAKDKFYEVLHTVGHWKHYSRIINSIWLSMTLASNVSTKKMQSIYWMPIKPLQSGNRLNWWMLLYNHTWLKSWGQIYWNRMKTSTSNNKDMNTQKEPLQAIPYPALTN